MLRCGGELLQVEDSLLQLASGRAHVGQFVTTGTAVHSVMRRPVLRGSAVPITGSPAPWGFVEPSSGELSALIPDDMWAAESVLRVAWQLSTHRQGGVLMHGCGLRFGDRGLAAIGRSGAGKSTLARLCADSEARAAILTDEIVQLLEDGRIFGSPFRSNVENVGQPGPACLVGVLLLEKGPREAISPVEPAEAAAELMSQLYSIDVPGTASLPELRRRVLALMAKVGVFRLTFRKDVAVGPFLREWVAAR